MNGFRKGKADEEKKESELSTLAAIIWPYNLDEKRTGSNVSFHYAKMGHLNVATPSKLKAKGQVMNTK
jgi:hypothetical protein